MVYLKLLRTSHPSGTVLPAQAQQSLALKEFVDALIKLMKDADETTLTGRGLEDWQITF